MKSTIKNRHSQIGFTLIELLVVVSMMVVLLALLTPALDKAMYQAELSVCMSHLHTIGSAVVTYASANRRHYPNRAGVDIQGNATYANNTWFATGAWYPHLLWNGGTPGDAYDDRARLRPYLGVNAAMNDPLAQKADIEGAKKGSHTFATYYLWFGWHFAGQPGMNRIGDRFTWTDASNPPQTYDFNVLAGDQDDVRYPDTLGGTTASHPDHDGKLASHLYQDAGSPQSVLARWAAAAGIKRGSMEMSFVFADDHVQRFDSVDVDNDPRMAKVPNFNGSTNTQTQWTHLPTDR